MSDSSSSSSAPPSDFMTALADAVVAAINASSAAKPFIFAASITAKRVYLALANLDEVSDTPIIQVVPNSDTATRLGGGAMPAFDGDYDISLMLYQRVGAGATAEAKIANLMILRQQMRDCLRSIRLTVAGPRTTYAVLSAVDATPAYNHADLLEKHVFVSEQILKFKIAV